MIETLQEITAQVTLYRDTESGIAYVQDASSGHHHCAHPTIDATGDVWGMKGLGHWAISDRTVKSHGYIYNIDKYVVDDELDRLAAEHCQCGGEHPAGN